MSGPSSTSGSVSISRTCTLRSYPHKPSVEQLAELRSRTEIFLRQAETLREAAMRRSDGVFFATLAQHRLAMAALDYAVERPMVAVAANIRAGVLEFVTSLELGRRTGPPEVSAYFLAALAVDERRVSHLLAALPGRALSLPARPADLPHQFHFRVASALFRGDEHVAAMFLEVMEGLAFDLPPDDESRDSREDLQNLCRLFESLVRKNAAAFDKHLRERANVLARLDRPEECDDPRKLADLQAAGLCRLARDRGMNVTVRHVYLPLELLDVPPPPS